MASAFAGSRPKNAAVSSPASRTARAWVSVMLPQPTRPTRSATLAGGRELGVRVLGLLLRERAGEDQEQVAEGGRAALLDREVELLLAVAEDLRPERIRGE